MLGITQIVGYGSLYYAFAILAADMAASFDWPVSRIFGVFSLALLVGGLTAPIAGRWMDRFGAPALMTAGSALASAALLAVAAAPGPVTFTVALVVLQCVATFVLYDAAFTALVQTRGSDARLRIMHLTLIAGFASTIFWPLTAWLNGWLDWRSVMLAFAVLNLLICTPIHAILARARIPEDDAPTGADAARPTFDPGPPMPPAAARRAFLLVTAGFALSGFLLSALLAQMVPALTALGLGGTALVVSTLFGPAQVLVRFVNMVFGVRHHPLTITIAGMSMLVLAVGILAATAPGTAGGRASCRERCRSRCSGRGPTAAGSAVWRSPGSSWPRPRRSPSPGSWRSKDRWLPSSRWRRSDAWVSAPFSRSRASGGPRRDRRRRRSTAGGSRRSGPAWTSGLVAAAERPRRPPW
jgi:MFS family permease